MLTFTTQEDAIYYMEQSGYKLVRGGKGIMKNTCGSTVRVVKGRVEWTTEGNTNSETEED